MKTRVNFRLITADTGGATCLSGSQRSILREIHHVKKRKSHELSLYPT
jgi:hypothetical protein